MRDNCGLAPELASRLMTNLSFDEAFPRISLVNCGRLLSHSRSVRTAVVEKDGSVMVILETNRMGSIDKVREQYCEAIGEFSKR